MVTHRILVPFFQVRVLVGQPNHREKAAHDGAAFFMALCTALSRLGAGPSRHDRSFGDQLKQAVEVGCENDLDAAVFGFVQSIHRVVLAPA